MGPPDEICNLFVCFSESRVVAQERNGNLTIAQLHNELRGELRKGGFEQVLRRMQHIPVGVL